MNNTESANVPRLVDSKTNTIILAQASRGIFVWQTLFVLFVDLMLATRIHLVCVFFVVEWLFGPESSYWLFTYACDITFMHTKYIQSAIRVNEDDFYLYFEFMLST